MKTVAMYETEDDRVFESEALARKAEGIKAAVSIALEHLGHVPKQVEHGVGWCQHSAASVISYKLALLKIARPLLAGFPEIAAKIEADPVSVHAGSIVGRIINDCACGQNNIWAPLDHAWGRLGCIDSLYREHQQPYYAYQGPRPEQICVEERR